MGLIDKIDNKAKHLSSKRSEVAGIDGIRKDIEKENETIKARLSDIGQYFWKLYSEGKYIPKGADKEFFEAIDSCNENIRVLTIQIDDYKLKGIKERECIDEDYRRKAEEREKEAEARRNEKAAAKQAKKESKLVVNEQEDDKI